MITKSDALLLLFELKNDGVDISSQMKELLATGEPSIDLIRFINNSRELDLTKFYEKIRRSYNEKHSTLYKGIVREDIVDPKETLTTLSSLQLQILLFNKQVEDPMFLKHARLEEISACIHNYAKTGDIIPCQKLLKIIKADLKCCESFKKNQE